MVYKMYIIIRKNVSGNQKKEKKERKYKMKLGFRSQFMLYKLIAD